MTAPLIVLVNPTSGSGRGARWGAAVVQLLRERQVPTHVIMGADADAARRARALLAGLLGQGAPPNGLVAGLVAVGGDGLVHLALDLALAHDLPLGLVAAGSGNDFARAVGVPARNPAQAIEIVLAAMAGGDLPRVDVGQLDGGPAFGCVLSAGFDAAVNARANRLAHLHGRSRYPVAMLAELRRFRALDCVLTVDGVQHHHRAMLIAVGNGASYGGGMRICPDASLTDGLLDVTVVDEIRVGELLRMFPRVYSGRHMEHPQAHSYRGQTVTLDFAGDVPPPVFADGESMAGFLSAASCTARVRPGAVRLLAPALT